MIDGAPVPMYATTKYTGGGYGGAQQVQPQRGRTSPRTAGIADPETTTPARQGRRHNGGVDCIAQSSAGRGTAVTTIARNMSELGFAPVIAVLARGGDDVATVGKHFRPNATHSSAAPR